jgi:hypothetical protein
MRNEVIDARVRDRIHRILDGCLRCFLLIGRLRTIGIDHLEAFAALLASAAAKLGTFALTLTGAIAR